MENERPEFFKLDQVDQKVLFWLLDNPGPKSVKSWLEYIADDYLRNRDIAVNVHKLFQEVTAVDAG